MGWATPLMPWVFAAHPVTVLQLARLGVRHRPGRLAALPYRVRIFFQNKISATSRFNMHVNPHNVLVQLPLAFGFTK